MGLTAHPRARLLFAEVVASAVYLGLAVLGRGGFVGFFSEPALCAIAVVFLVLLSAAAFTEGNISAGVREDRSNRWVIAVISLVGIVAAYLPTYTDRIGVWTIDGSAVRWLGVALFALGGLLRIWPVFVLGRRFSGLVAIQPGHALVTDGIYRVIRHPSYLGLLINSLGWGLAFRSLAGVLLAVSLVLPVLARIGAEERMLRSEFGTEYEAYLSRTWRLFPGLY